MEMSAKKDLFSRLFANGTYFPGSAIYAGICGDTQGVGHSWRGVPENGAGGWSTPCLAFLGLRSRRQNRQLRGPEHLAAAVGIATSASGGREG